MKIRRFDDFITEAKKDKNTVVELFVKLLKEKPLVKLDSKSFPDERGIYSLAGIKKYFKEHGCTNADADDAIYHIEATKEFKTKYKVGYIKVKNHHYNESYPYYYIDMTEDQANKVKESLEKMSQEKSKPMIAKKEEVKKAAVSKKADDRKTPKKPRVAKAKTTTKPKATRAKKAGK